MFGTERVKSQESRVKSQTSERSVEGGRRAARRSRSSLLAPGSLLPAPRSSRRGVLLLVVLSVLVLFMLIGTAFLMSSSQSRDAAKNDAKAKRLDKPSTKRLDNAFAAIVRDTENPNATIRYHSLLRDLYGTDGFQATIYRPDVVNLANTNKVGQVTRFAEAIVGTPAQQLGPTQGQFIDIYVRQLAGGLNDPLTTVDEAAQETQAAQLNLPRPRDLRHVLKIDRNGFGQSQVHALPLTKGYYNGCLLTITSGPASGQTTRILEYEHIADIAPTQVDPAPGLYTRLFRFRVMSFPRADGQPLRIDQSTGAGGRMPELADLAGATILVNGRAFGGTGVGYNPLAQAGSPRLSALQIEPLLTDKFLIGTEIALTPNSRYVFAATPATANQQTIGALVTGGDPYGTNHDPTEFVYLNKAPLNGVTATNYGWFPGHGGANEPYDAADYQNMMLGVQTVTPRARGRVVHSTGGSPPNTEETYEATDPQVVDASGVYVNTDKFLRLDLEDLPLPSLHRPDLINFWYHRMIGSQWLSDACNNDADRAAKSVLQPYNADGTLPTWVPSAQVAAQITSLKRRISMRPLREDHPLFDGSNPLSRPVLTSNQGPVITDGGSGITYIGIPYWEVTGPWDVDNDNDGIPDSNWVDLGDPVQEAEDGTRYKPLYAILCIDLDSRLNVNAHGLVDHVKFDPNHQDLSLDYDYGDGTYVHRDNLAGTWGNTRYNTNLLAAGSGYGPAEISLRPVFPAPWSNTSGALYEANRVEDNNLLGSGTPDGQVNNSDAPIDSYAALLVGRYKLGKGAVRGRYGYITDSTGNVQKASPGVNYNFFNVPQSPTGDSTQPDFAAQIKFFNYPSASYRLIGSSYTYGVLSDFGMPPDLMGRYATGLDYSGQPVIEAQVDLNPNTIPLGQNSWRANHLLADSPYELDLSSAQRREPAGAMFPNPSDAFDWSINPPKINPVNTAPGQNDDAAFATTDLERVLRAMDADAGVLPSRLWDVVDVFDPVKLMQFDPYRVTATAMAAFNNSSPSEPERLVAAQQIAAINRRLVTTDSSSLPVASSSRPGYISELGPDGAPGRAGVDDDNVNGVDDPGEIGAPGSDDFRSIIGKPLAQATIVDIFYYRVFLEARQKFILSQGWQEPLTAAQLATLNNQIAAPLGLKATVEALAKVNLAQSLLAPELLAGQRMDLNRPFGDGRDNAGDGIDSDGDGFIDATDYNNNGRIDPPYLQGTNWVDERIEQGDPMNKADGVVDDLLEAGDPFLDIDGNGRWQNEPYIDLDGNGVYSPPRDQMWAGAGMSESIGFDYTNGVGVPIHPQVSLQSSNPQIPLTATVRNLEWQGRQLYARHLYCLMLLLVDQGFIAPLDINDPQVYAYINSKSPTNLSPQADYRTQMTKNVLAALQALPTPPADPVQEADRIMRRKLTCRMIAQWAINCVEMRDSDAIMTPFEYDEYPWDGWGCLDRSGVNNIPLDGDPSTNENGDESLSEADLPTKNMAGVIDWNSLKNGGPKAITYALVQGPSTSLNQTRGVVWGAERPELLITETMAFHDRRTEDTNQDWTGGYLTGAQGSSANASEREVNGGKTSLDQRLRPRGGLFVEVYNPWSPSGQHPAELYSLFDTTTGKFKDRNGDGSINPNDFMGVELGRLSTLGARETVLTVNGQKTYQYDLTAGVGNSIKRSPVWRLIVVEENPLYRQSSADFDDKFDDEPNPPPLGTGVHTKKLSEKYSAGTGRFFEPADPDFGSPTFFGQELPPATAVSSLVKFPENEPYVERSFYFTSDNSDRHNKSDLERMSLVKDPKLKLRLPPRLPVVPPPSAQTTQPTQSEQYFIAADILKANVAAATDIPDVSIAPILPGRYAVIGTAGAQYTGLETRDVQGAVDTNGNPILTKAPRFVTTLSRFIMSKQFAPPGELPANSTMDTQQVKALDKTRRIELLPSPNPEVQQVLVAGNGGTPLFPRVPGGSVMRRDNEVVKLESNVPPNQRFRNIFDLDNDGNPDPFLIPPCVAIPVTNMSVSEPLDVYQKRAVTLRDEETKEFNAAKTALASNPTLSNQIKSPPGHFWNPLAAGGEGCYVAGKGPPNDIVPGPFNEPFDTAKELMRNGTTRNYRTIHLQRLANPTLPWNPPPALPNGPANNDDKTQSRHDPKLPVNIYITIDTASVDLTAYNGASSRELDDPTQGRVRELGRVLPEKGDLQKTKLWDDLFGPTNPPPAGTNWMAYGIYRMNFRSRERGWQATAPSYAGNVASSATTSPELALVPRTLWRQEPISRYRPHVATDGKGTDGVYRNDMAEWKILSTDDLRVAELKKRTNDLRIRNSTRLKADIDAIKSTATTDPSVRDVDFDSFPDPDDTKVPLRPIEHHFDIVLKHTLGFQNESFGALTSREDAFNQNLPETAAGKPLEDRTFAPTGTPAVTNGKFSRNVPDAPDNQVELTQSTFPWLSWVNRPFISSEELLQVPAASSSKLLRQFSTINGNIPSDLQSNPYDGRGYDNTQPQPNTISPSDRLRLFFAPYGHLLNFFATADFIAHTVYQDNSGQPFSDGWRDAGAPHFYRILDYVHVPSRYVGTDDMLTAEIFNDNPLVANTPVNPSEDILGTSDPRSNFRPPFNKVSRQRDPGKVNLNTVTSRRQVLPNGVPNVWSEVYDGLMHRYHDGNSPTGQLSHLGPAWRDVVTSRRGYLDISAQTSDRSPDNIFPDVRSSLLNPNFPTVFSNPFRPAEASDMVPLQNMVQPGVQATWMRSHPYAPDVAAPAGTGAGWGRDNFDDNGDGLIDDAREAGIRPPGVDSNGVPYANDGLVPSAASRIPLFSETTKAAYVDGERNPYFYYQPMSRLRNLVTDRSNVYAIWITVGYFEVHPAPDWNSNQNNIQQKMGGDGSANSPATLAAQALYNRVYPDGYTLGREVGSDTGDTHRDRGFYIIDRSEPVGFKPGEDLNMERMIRLRRRIE